MKKIWQLNAITLSVCLAQQAYALELIQDAELSEMIGQDGISITHEVSKITADKINWYDPSNLDNATQSTQKKGLGIHNLEILGTNGQPIKSDLSIDVGATAHGAGLGISASVSPFTANADLKMVKVACSGASCTPQDNSIRVSAGKVLTDAAGNNPTQGHNPTQESTLGKIGLGMTTPFNIDLKTTAGLFNKEHTATMTFALQNATLTHQMGKNKLMLHDLNFNFQGTGYMYIDAEEGLVLSTYNGKNDQNIVDLNRVADTTDVGRSNATNPGVNLDYRYYTPNNERKNIIRMGASGAVTNAKIAINSNQSNLNKYHVGSNYTSNTATDVTPTQSGADVVGSGIHLNVSADFLNRDGLSRMGAASTHLPTTLEIGHTGKGSYAVEFSDIRSLSPTDIQGKSVNAFIDFGDMYLNTVTLEQYAFAFNRKIADVLRFKNPAYVNAATTPNVKPFLDYTNQQLAGSNSNDYVFFGMRGMDFQAIAARARFISDNSLAALSSNTKTWGIGIPIYNLNANLFIAGKDLGAGKQGLAYNIIASTEGYGIDTKKQTPSTTSLLLIDGHTGQHSGEVVNYYAGLRNIDSYIESKGLITYEDDGILITADKLLIAANAEIAVGQLPGSKFNCDSTVNTACNGRVSNTIFGEQSDVITTLAFKLDGKGNLLIIPGIENPNAGADNQPQNFLSVVSNFEFNTPSNDALDYGSTLSLINEDKVGTGSTATTRKSSVNLNRMQGHLGINGQIYMKENSAVVDTQVKFNYKSNPLANQKGKAFTAEMAMSPAGASMQKVADLAITGGNLRSTMTIAPR